MKPILDESQPIFQQIATIIMTEIIDGSLHPGDRIPSENELSNFYTINRATVRKGLQLLVDQHIIYKKRGIGMFVAEKALIELKNSRHKQFREAFIIPILAEAKRLDLDLDAVITLLKEEEMK